VITIGILTGNSLSDFNFNVLSNILRDESIKIKIAISERAPSKTLFQKIQKNIKRGRGGYIMIMAIHRLLSNKKRKYNIDTFCEFNKIELFQTKDPYSNETVEKIKNCNLDMLILINGYGIIREPLLSITKYGILSYHHGDMRKYRGMPPALWELYNNETEMGVTVQLLEKGLDCGSPIIEKKITIEKKDNLTKLKMKALKQSENMMHEAIFRVSKKDFQLEKLEKLGNIYTLPNLRQWLILQMKLILRQFN
jgi:folate-dependent phosphoribosylglycinamide formyltransferase PurN